MSVWRQLAADAEPELVAQAVRLAVARVPAETVRHAVAQRLERGGNLDVRDLLASLVATQAGHVDETGVARAAERLARVGTRVDIVGQPGYPARLADAWPELGAPLWLFAVTAGARPLPDGPAVAVVGTRQPSLDGLRTARALGHLLAEAGITVVSGLARGIDQAAHRGALDAEGPTVAVLGTGFEVNYPAGSIRLRAAIAEAGGVVTELAPGAGPKPQHFLARNRIISGLADVTVVVEGRARSGALQTARLAASQGREVLAVPGSLNAPTSRAPLALIRDGARPLTCLEEVLEVVDALPPRGPAPAQPVPPPLRGLDPVARRVWELLGPTPASVTDLAGATGAGISHVLAAVSELTARGLAEHAGRGVIRVV